MADKAMLNGICAYDFSVLSYQNCYFLHYYVCFRSKRNVEAEILHF